MRITNSTIDSLSQNGLTMVDENSASDAYIEENTYDRVENGHNAGIDNSNITNVGFDDSNATSTNINSNTTTT